MIESTNQILRGYVLAILAAVFWGISGALGQFLIVERDINIEWLITIRLLISGVILLTIANTKKDVRSPWRKQSDALRLIIFSLFGVLAVQYTFFSAIKHSNAATATVLQSTAPVLIAVYLAIYNRRWPPFTQLLAILLAITGTFLIVTHGSLQNLTISRLAVFWGLATAVTLAFYSLQPRKLIERYSPVVILGWGMLIGGVIFSFVYAPWKIEGQWDIYTYSYTTFIILFATVIAFYAYLMAVNYIGAQLTSLLAAIEPLTAAIIAVAWLGVDFSFVDWLGCFCIIISVVFLILPKKLMPKNRISK